MIEVRHDKLLNRVVIISPKRALRPHEFIKEKSQSTITSCPFCPGNEKMTPPATFYYYKINNELKHGFDKNGERSSNWLIRIFPNLYPIFSIENSKIDYHYVIVDSPNHDDTLASMNEEQIQLSLLGTFELIEKLYKEPSIKYVHAFKNYGKDAGASLSHTHNQLIALTFIPPLIMDEIKRSQKKCFICKVIERERKAKRIIYENKTFVAFVPWSAIQPYEFWITPLKHEPIPNKDDISDLSQVISLMFKTLYKTVGDVSYNMWFHIAPKENEKIMNTFHWHIEVQPKISTWASLELGANVYVNILSPEDATKNLKNNIT
jgi:UDPglucose--hexose-1-phosphate uridylyltransferase